MAGGLPKRLILGLGVTAVFFLIVGLYAEVFHLQKLQGHPVMTNLLSGLIAFPCASLVIAIGFNWFAERERLSKLKAVVPGAWAPIATYYTEAQTSDEHTDIAGETARLNSLLRLHEQVIKFRIPLVVHLLDLQDDFIVISHLRMLEERYAALAGPPKLKLAVRRAGLEELTNATMNLVRRIAVSESGRKLDLPRVIPDLGDFHAA